MSAQEIQNPEPAVIDDVKQDVEEDQEEKVELVGSLAFEEEVDMNILRAIRDNFPEAYKRMGGVFKTYDEKLNKYVKADEQTAYTIINNLYNSKLKSTTVSYHFLPRLKSGRRFSNFTCLQGIARQVRHTISKGIYHDIDMKNAHPTFASQLCKELKFTHRVLDVYINNRDECITRWIGVEVVDKELDKQTKKWKISKRILKNKDEAKEYFLKILNGGGNIESNCDELNEFKKRCVEFHDHFYKLPQFKRFRDRAIKKYEDKAKKVKKEKKEETKEEKENDNRRGTAFNYYLCEVENVALTHIEKYLEEQGFRIGALCFDGCMIYKKDVKDLHDLLKKLEALLIEKMGFSVTMTCKEMNEDFNVSDFKIKEEIKTTDEDYAKYLLEALKDDMKYDSFSNELWFWEEEEALWRQQKPKHIRTYITKVLIPYINTSPDKEVIEEQTLLIKTDAKQSALVRMCEPYIEKRRDDAFISENFNRQKGLYPIADKQIVDFKTNTVRDRTKTDYFTKTTNNKVVNVSTEERAEIFKYYEDLLTTKQGKKSSEKHRDGLISIFAYGMTGENHLKKFINFIGERDGGKSLCVEHHNNILGEFGGSANERLFVAQKNKSCHDSELFNLRGKRLVSLTETSKDQKFNEDLIKKITGGDKINIRGAGDKKTIDEKFNTLLILATNNMCDFSDEAFMSRLICYNFCNQFKKDASVPERLSQLQHQFFTVLCEYAKMFYDNKRNIDWSEEAINYTQTVCEEKDTVKVWIRDDLQIVVYDNENKEHDEKTFYLEKTQLYPKYCEFWAKNGKTLLKKNDFYKSFEKHFNLPVAKKMTKNKQSLTGYEGIRMVEEEVPQDVEDVEEEKEQPKSFFGKPQHKSDLDAGL